MPRLQKRKLKQIILTPGIACKCSCRKHTGNDGNIYWVDIRKKIVYSTNCHDKNPKKAKGIFKIQSSEAIQQI